MIASAIFGADIAGISGALYALAAFLTALASLIGVFFTHRQTGKVKEIVNGKNDQIQAENNRMRDLLTKHGIDPEEHHP
jgi:hypothetical protein